VSRKSDPNFLVKQPHGYCFRINVPVDLRKRIGLREVRYSLKTKDYLTAKAKALPLGLQVRRFFSELRARSECLSQLSSADIKRLIKEFISKELDKAETKRLLCNNIPPDQLQDIKSDYGTTSYNSWEALTHRRYDAVSDLAQSLIDSNELTAPVDSIGFKELCRELIRATGYIASINLDRENGAYGTEQERDPDLYAKYLAEPVVPPSPAVAEDDSPLLSESIALFLKERGKAKNWKGSYKTECLNALGLYQEFAGGIRGSQVDSKLTVAWKYALIKTPKHRNKTDKYKGKTIHQLLKMDIPNPMSEGNADRLITRLSTYFNWAKAHGHIKDNYARGIKFGNKVRDDEKRQAFTPQDLHYIFNSQEYKDNLFKHPYQYWAPYLALFTGMRVQEIGQLYLDDIYQTNGIWVVSVNDNAPDKQLKGSTNAKRDIPLHPIFTELAFPEFVQELRNKGKQRLFPEINKTSKGYGDTISRAFNRDSKSSPGFLRKWGVKGPNDKGKKVFHSFRHTFIDHLKQKLVPIPMLQQLAGHKNKSETLDRYGKPYSPQTLYDEVIVNIDFRLS